LLHFFANHELLATELMALVLLKFPEAPRAFRFGVLGILKDEQIHTRLYLKRMRECGIEFGELPLSGYFWRTVSSMEQPVDFVARLSLTFEQANLDYCRYFGEGFDRAGDDATARLLNRVYRDEIGHVAHGLKWFRRWKRVGESDWDAFCRHLQFPLSPARAKGNRFNAAGRREAGFDPSFIDELNVYSQSRGRTPGVFLFNPFAESVIAQGKRFHPVKSQVQLARDLCNLPQYLCRQDDVVLVEKRPSLRFLSGLKQAGFALPEFITVRRGAVDPTSSLPGRKLARLRPWAWSPDSLHLLQPLFEQVTLETIPPARRFNQGIAQLYSKAWSAAFLKRLLHGFSGVDWICPVSVAGAAAGTLDAAMETIQAIRHSGHHRVVVKECYGMAGHNMIRLWEPRMLESQRTWIAKAIDRTGQVVVEPWLERVMDFSVQLEMDVSGLRRVGYTCLLNDPGGQFQGCWAGPKHARKLPVEPTVLFGGETRRLAEFYELYDRLIQRLEADLRTLDYLGPIGIDAFIYAGADGRARLKPVVEVNPRYTLGRLTLELMRRASSGCSGVLRLVNLPLLKKGRFASFDDYARHLAQSNPLFFEGTPVPKIASGAICLNDPLEAQAYLAVFEVGQRLVAREAGTASPGGLGRIPPVAKRGDSSPSWPLSSASLMNPPED